MCTCTLYGREPQALHAGQRCQLGHPCITSIQGRSACCMAWRPVNLSNIMSLGTHARQQGNQQRLDYRVACFEGAVHAHQHSSDGCLPLKSRSQLAAARAQSCMGTGCLHSKTFLSECSRDDSGVAQTQCSVGQRRHRVGLTRAHQPSSTAPDSVVNSTCQYCL